MSVLYWKFYQKDTGIKEFNFVKYIYLVYNVYNWYFPSQFGLIHKNYYHCEIRYYSHISYGHSHQCDNIIKWTIFKFESLVVSLINNIKLRSKFAILSLLDYVSISYIFLKFRTRKRARMKLHVQKNNMLHSLPFLMVDTSFWGPQCMSQEGCIISG